jgi:hypothetical protein
MKIDLIRRRDRLRADGNAQQRVVKALSAMGESMLARGFPLDARPNSGQNAAAWISLRGTLRCWTPALLNRLIHEEGAENPRNGPSLVLHIIATNTPLLAWSSVARALLVEAASIVRIPPATDDVALWTRLFVTRLCDADPDVADLIELDSWPSADTSTTEQRCRDADAVLVYGSDETVASVRALTPPHRLFLGYGNRLSFGLVLAGSNLEAAAAGCALDIAIFDQRGCLSPQILFVEGDQSAAERFSGLLEHRLHDRRDLFPGRGAVEAAEIREAIAMARMEAGVSVAADRELAYTVIGHRGEPVGIPSAPGLVHVMPTSGWDGVRSTLARLGLAGKLQGASLSAPNEEERCKVMNRLAEFGVSTVCSPGELQIPSFGWRENGYHALGSLIGDSCSLQHPV